LSIITRKIFLVINWEPLTEDVYTLDEKYSEVPSEFCFGCEDINTVFTEYVWSGFSYHDDEDYDIQETSYQDSINWCLAQIFNGIQKNEINKSTINSFLANHHSIPITEINNCGIVFLEDDKAQIFRHLDDGKTDLLTDVKLF